MLYFPPTSTSSATSHAAAADTCTDTNDLPQAKLDLADFVSEPKDDDDALYDNQPWLLTENRDGVVHPRIYHPRNRRVDPVALSRGRRRRRVQWGLCPGGGVVLTTVV